MPECKLQIDASAHWQSEVHVVLQAQEAVVLVDRHDLGHESFEVKDGLVPDLEAMLLPAPSRRQPSARPGG